MKGAVINTADSQNTFSYLSAPARRALARAGYTQLEELTKVRESELALLHGIGPNALIKLRAALGQEGLAFRPEKS